MTDLGRLLFIVNPNAGVGGRDPGRLIASILGDRPWDVVYTERPGHATDLAQAGVADGYDTVVAVGGDGTLNEVGRALAGTGSALGILPAGSGNALARALGIPVDPAGACRVIAAGHTRWIDVARVGDDTFLSTTGFGLDAEVCRRYNDAGGRRGLFSYVRHALHAIFTREDRPVRLYLDGSSEAITVRPTLLSVANTPAFGYGATIAPGAEPDDGLLDLVVAEGLTVFRALRHGHRLFNGSFDRTPGVSRYRVREVRVERDEAGPVQADGETCAPATVTRVHVLPRALRVVAPG